ENSMLGYRRKHIPLPGKYKVITFAGNGLPQLIRRKTQDRRNPSRQSFCNMEQGCLTGAARQAIGLTGVLAILDDIQIKTAEVHRTKVVYFLVNQMKLITMIGFDNFFLQLRRTLHRPAIQRQQILRSYLMLLRIKGIEIG